MNRMNDIYRPATERLRDFNEVERRLGSGELHEQATRCMNCGIPFCHGAGCPLENRIPDINQAAAQGRWHEAWRILSATSPFPEFTSRVCPALCEGACVQGIGDEAVMVRQLEKAVTEHAFADHLVTGTPTAPNGRRIAVVGAGPAGLSAANALAKRGYAVTVFEKHHTPGGLLRYGIPDFKLDKALVARRVKLLESQGVRFECDTEIGRDLAGDYLARRFDAILIAVGTPAARDLTLPGRELKNIHFALEFLQGQNRAVAGEVVEVPISAAGKHVVIVGGGDTGSDCLGTALRQHAASVTQVEIMPRPPANRSDSTPWPAWPWLLRTSSSHHEGGTRLWNIQSSEFIGTPDDGITGLRVHDVQWEFSTSGKPLRFSPVAGSDRVLRADLVLIAMGFTGVNAGHWAVSGLDLARDERGRLQSDPARGIFVAGDSANGASLVVRAIADGQVQAARIDQYCRGL